MAESQPAERPEAAEGEMVPDLDEGQLNELTMLVLRMLRDEISLATERSGQRPIRR